MKNASGELQHCNTATPQMAQAALRQPDTRNGAESTPGGIKMLGNDAASEKKEISRGSIREPQRNIITFAASEMKKRRGGL